ncbi:hypothetical protein F5141DRAFT_1032487 [Pisolithus sp. B1]|nr:hypothetical protein F5141DRAFT_1032487 [Pisolithus sp. B1]
MSKSTFTWWYWVRGTPLLSIDFIEASPETTVATLKKRIFESEPDLQGGPKNANLYKIPETHQFPVDGEYEHEFSALSISHLGQPLRSARKLSNIFASHPKDDHLHFILDATITVDIWTRGGDPLRSLSISISRLAKVNQLKDRVKEIRTDFADISTDRLGVYKLSFDGHDDLKEILDKHGDGTFLPGEQELETFFNDLPFSQKAARVVVEVLPEQGPGRLPPSSSFLLLTGDDPIGCARNAFLANRRSRSPSENGMPSSFRTDQFVPDKCIPCGRPLSIQETIPPSLLHPVFGQFLDDCQNMEVTREEGRIMYRLAVVLSDMYSDETARKNAVFKILGEYGIHLSTAKIDKYEVDAEISIHGNRYLIAEIKNEMSSTNSDAYLQAVLYYLEATRLSAVKHSGSVLPCLLLILVGPYIIFAGAAWNLRPHAQTLSTPLLLNSHHTDKQNLLVVARHIAAFRKAIRSLKEHYDTAPFSPLTPSPPLRHIFPWPTSFYTPDGSQKVDFTYERPLYDNKLLFFGTRGDTQERICIKFAPSYSKEAHECCVTLNCAPALLGFNSIPGGWTIVAMEALTDYTSLYQLTKSTPLTLCVFEALYEEMLKCLKSFHDKGFVHGDIRDTNIMISHDRKNVKFIDFDWAGKADDKNTRYPCNVNTLEVKRPDDVEGWAPIQKCHDEAMLGNIANDIRSRF